MSSTLRPVPRRATARRCPRFRTSRQGRYDGAAGARLRVLAADGSTRTLTITGQGRNMTSGLEVGDAAAVVLYTTPATVAALSGETGFTSLLFRLRDSHSAEGNATVTAVERYLRANTSFTGFADLPDLRAPGDWPGKVMFEKFSQLLYVVTVLALLSALVLIVNTMTTLVSEQTREIGQMKAIGGTNRQITAVYLRTAFLLGAIGSVLGAALGIGLANLVTNYFGTSFYGTPAQLAVDMPVLVASLAIGLVGPMLAALPAIRRGVRMPSARRSSRAAPTQAAPRGSTARFAASPSCRGPRRSAFAAWAGASAAASPPYCRSRSRSARCWPSSASPPRSTNLTVAGWADHRWQVWVGSSLQQPLDARAERLIRATPGVADARPALVNEIELSGNDGFAWGVPARTLFRYRLADGRWYTPAEERADAHVAVIENAIARAAGVHVGDRIRLTTATGPAQFRVIGLLDNVQENGTVVFVPLATLKSVLRTPDAVNAYWVTTTSTGHDAIDATTTRIEDALTAYGYQVGTEITYVGERENVAGNRQLTTTITVLGFLIVAISMVGLVSAISMNVLERTREVGILRCLGARGKDIRRIFATEGLVLALTGWLVGIPLGYAIDRLFGWLIGRIFGFELAVAFPPMNVLIALGGTIVLALLIMRIPLRRAVRLRPGEALRYA